MTIENAAFAVHILAKVTVCPINKTYMDEVLYMRYMKDNKTLKM
jgi:hypothetical protein